MKEYYSVVYKTLFSTQVVTFKLNFDILLPLVSPKYFGKNLINYVNRYIVSYRTALHTIYWLFLFQNSVKE